MTDPEVLILDEPTAGQDYRHYTEIIGFVEELNRRHGKTILLITHDLHLALEHTDRALVFADAMDLRGFGKLKRRTWYADRPPTRQDWAARAAIAALAAMTAFYIAWFRLLHPAAHAYWSPWG